MTSLELENLKEMHNVHISLRKGVLRMQTNSGTKALAELDLKLNALGFELNAHQQLIVEPAFYLYESA